MRARVVTGVVLGILAIAAFVTGAAATVALTSVVLGLCVIELSNALRRAGYQPATLLAIVAAVGAPVAVYQRGVDGLLVVVAISTAFSLLWFLAKAGDESPVLNAGVTMLSVCYIGVLGSYGALMLRVFGDYGIGMILAAVLGTVGHDIGALLVGRSAGKTKLTSVSPGKTREGLIGGMLTSIIVVVVAVGMFKIAPFGEVPADRKGIWFGGMPQAALLGLVIAVTAPLGDLVESLIKRDLGVKDMGNILKGHGGVLDRFDALLFTLPATYYIARFVIL
jgi:phosphatidate cytidylyltransferase